MTEYNYVEEVAPLTEEQWECIISWHRKRSGREVTQALLAAKPDSLYVTEFEHEGTRHVSVGYQPKHWSVE